MTKPEKSPRAEVDFDEATPPPRTRPEGQPVPRFVRLPPGEDPVALFREWDRAGRIPSGAVLCELIGTRPGGTGKKSGYRLLAVGATAVVGPADIGRELTDEVLDEFRIAVEVRRSRDPQWYVVFAPAAKGGR